jgi:16S rRNA (adenine1518-N6/adenine1519-N6)-dimethyltransferase
MNKVRSQGIALKKQYGQHFLRDQAIVERIVDSVELDQTSSVFEIGCGDGFLTRTILKENIARLWVFEIDHEWVEYIKKSIHDKRLEIFEQNILDLDFSVFKPDAPWTLLANLPYQITFPILHMLQHNRVLLKEGVIMVQEEVAQKIMKTSGKGYGFPSLYFQHFFDWKVLDKIAPSAFYPPPKVYSRLLYFKPKQSLQEIPDEENFWKFIKTCFKQPRRTLKNNLAQTHYQLNKLDEKTLTLRAQQLDMEDLVQIWKKIC